MRVARDAMLKWRRRERRSRHITATWRSRPVRQRTPSVTKRKIVPIRRFAPRHTDKTPVSKLRAA
jgi:hypothetical protein